MTQNTPIITGEPVEETLTPLEEEQKQLMKQYADLLEKHGGRHRQVRRIMDKENGKQNFKLGSYSFKSKK